LSRVVNSRLGVAFQDVSKLYFAQPNQINGES